MGKEKIAAIVPAAGIGKRFSEDENKTFCHFLSKPLIIWTLEALHGVEEISEIIPVFRQDDLLLSSELIEKYNVKKVKRIVPGGKERQDSVYNALSFLDDNIGVVVIHDGVRPFVQRDLIKKAISELKGFDGVITGVPVKDTIKEARCQVSSVKCQVSSRIGAVPEYESGSEIVVKKTLNRSLLWAIQTPQVFYFNRLIKAYEKAMSEGFYSTDDSSLIERYGGAVKIIMGSYTNIKITTPEDIYVAEAILKGG